MVNLKRIQADEVRAIGIELLLPACPLYLITCTHGFLCGSVFELSAFEKKQTGICIMEAGESFNDLMESTVQSMNEQAQAMGIKIGMSGYEAIKKMDPLAG